MPGKGFSEVIQEEVGKARCIMVLWSEVSVRKDWVIEEADDGKKRCILVPVLIEQLALPWGFRQIPAADLSSWRGGNSDAAFLKLYQAVGAMVSPATKKLPQEEPKQKFHIEWAANMDSIRQVDNAFGLEMAQLLAAKSLRYATLSEAREREIVEHAPELVFGPERGQIPLNHLADVLLYTHPDNTQFTRTALRQMLVSLGSETPAWKREAYVRYIGDGAIEDLLAAKLLSRVSKDSFVISPTEAVKAVRARFPKRP